MVWLSLFRPSQEQQRQVVDKGHSLRFNYAFPGCTEPSTSAPSKGYPGWNINHTRAQVATGQKQYNRAKRIVQQWGHFQLGWTEVDKQTPVKEGQGFCVVAKTMFMWSANPLEIIYVRDTAPPKPSLLWLQPWRRGREVSQASEFAFGGGCLNGHLIAGEERFRVQYEPKDQSVWFEIYSISRPAHPLSVVMQPLLRFYQGQYARDAVSNVKRLLLTGGDDEEDS